MVPTCLRWCALCTLAAVALTSQVQAQGQTAAPAPRPDPLDAEASVAPLRHASSLAQYRRPSEEKPIAWRDANDTVTRIGGWRIYLREAQQPDAAPAGLGGHKTP